jgi:hypothetical protein
MILAFISLLILGAQATLWLFDSLARPSASTSLQTVLTPSATLTTAEGLLLASLALLAISVVKRRALSIEIRLTSALVCALSAATAARAARLSDHASLSLYLWGAALVVAMYAGLLATRQNIGSSATNHFQDSAKLLALDRNSSTKMTPFIWLGLAITLITSALMYGYRMLDVPGELNSFGTQALVSAQRFLRGEVLFTDLILYREMTQEECGYSVLYVLWHAIFQVIFGGPSVWTARIACLVAVCASTIFIFRVGRHLKGSTFGLICAVVYAFMPVTLQNARNEGFFGFSSLLLLACADIVLGFARFPSTRRAILLGLSAPLIGYGLANIKMLYIATLAIIPVACLSDRHLRRNLWRLGFSAVISCIILIPQFLNLARVKKLVAGRGEHLFGGVLKDFAASDPLKRGLWGNAKPILESNFEYLSKGIVGPWNDQAVNMPGLMAIFAVVGFGVCILRLLRPDKFLIVSLAVAAYFAPLIAIPIVWNRLLLLNIAQALLISVVWWELWRLRNKAFNDGLTRTVILLSFFASLSAFYPVNSLFLSQRHNLPQVREYIIERAKSHVVFFTDNLETSLNFFLWNPPYIGRSSDAQIPLIGIRESGVSATKRLVEALNVPALIVANSVSTDQLAARDNWRSELTPGGMHALWYTPSASDHKAVVRAIDPFKLNNQSPLYIDKLNYHSPYLYESEVPNNGLTIDFQTTEALQQTGLMVRSGDSYSVAASVLVNQGSQQLTPIRDEAADPKTTWYITKSLAAGSHTLTLAKLSESSRIWVTDIILIGTQSR